jgi:hypothetical protein
MIVRMRGRVVRRRIGRGSKSEHLAVVLVSAEGEWILRRRGGNAFRDPALDALVEREWEFTGERVDTTFIVDSWVACG